MAGLSPEQIQALLGKTRQRGIYEEKLIEFVNSGEAGVEVNSQWVELADKKDTTLKQGFENAKQKAHVMEATEGKAELIKVIANEDRVYLVNLAHVEGAVPAEATAEAVPA